MIRKQYLDIKYLRIYVFKQNISQFLCLKLALLNEVAQQIKTNLKLIVDHFTSVANITDTQSHNSGARTKLSRVRKILAMSINTY